MAWRAETLGDHGTDADQLHGDIKTIDSAKHARATRERLAPAFINIISSVPGLFFPRWPAIRADAQDTAAGRRLASLLQPRILAAPAPLDDSLR